MKSATKFIRKLWSSFQNKGRYRMIRANDYVGPDSFPDYPDYDGCGYEFGDDYCAECDHYHECRRASEGNE